MNETGRLWSAVGRENLMIKVPATAEGVPAIEQLISEGISVNVTLLLPGGVRAGRGRLHRRAREARRPRW